MTTATLPTRRLPLAPDDPGLKKDTVVDFLKGVLRDGGPGFAQFAITNGCNAACAFCGFSVDKLPKNQYVYVTLDDAKASIDILYKNGIRFLVLVGGEPLMHRDIYAMITHARDRGMQPIICTNAGLFTHKTVDALIDAGLSSCIMSIDAATAKGHETNRRLPGVCDKIRLANKRFHKRGVQTTASVTLSRLVVDDLSSLPSFLKKLGFKSVTFSYPLKNLGSSYLSFSDSGLVDFDEKEMFRIFDELKRLRRQIHVVNPSVSIDEMKRFVRGEKQKFECYGGSKYFYLDWNLQLYRCHFWETPMCSIWDFDGSQRVRDGCTRCMIDCYRDPSVLQHIGMSISDAANALKRGRVLDAAKAILNAENVGSIRAVVEGLSWIGNI
ncbi:MAG: radical SAM protein [Planctomycetota bacterium]